MVTVSFIGLGNRGSIYAKYFAQSTDATIVAACDFDEPCVLQLNELYGVKKENLFTDEEEFFKEKRSDVLVISTLDDLHRRQTVRALSLGYDVLLEKTHRAECRRYAGDRRSGEKISKAGRHLS